MAQASPTARAGSCDGTGADRGGAPGTAQAAPQRASAHVMAPAPGTVAGSGGRGGPLPGPRASASRPRPGRLPSLDPEHRVVRGDGQQLVVGRIRADTLEEHADLELPLLEVGPQQARPVLDRYLGGGELLDPPADPQLATTGRPHIADPLRVPTGRNQVPLTLEGQWVHRGGPPLPRLAAAHG